MMKTSITYRLKFVSKTNSSFEKQNQSFDKSNDNSFIYVWVCVYSDSLVQFLSINIWNCVCMCATHIQLKCTPIAQDLHLYFDSANIKIPHTAQNQATKIHINSLDFVYLFLVVAASVVTFCWMILCYCCCRSFQIHTIFFFCFVYVVSNNKQQHEKQTSYFLFFQTVARFFLNNRTKTKLFLISSFFCAVTALFFFSWDMARKGRL